MPRLGRSTAIVPRRRTGVSRRARGGFLAQMTGGDSDRFKEDCIHYFLQRDEKAPSISVLEWNPNDETVLWAVRPMLGLFRYQVGDTTFKRGREREAFGVFGTDYTPCDWLEFQADGLLGVPGKEDRLPSNSQDLVFMRDFNLVEGLWEDNGAPARTLLSPEKIATYLEETVRVLKPTGHMIMWCKLFSNLDMAEVGFTTENVIDGAEAGLDFKGCLLKPKPVLVKKVARKKRRREGSKIEDVM